MAYREDSFDCGGDQTVEAAQKVSCPPPPPPPCSGVGRSPFLFPRFCACRRASLCGVFWLRWLHPDAGCRRGQQEGKTNMWY